MRGAWASLVSVLVFGVGVVLFGLGFDSHTTEALPFGVVAMGVGLALGVPSLRALRASLRPAPSPIAEEGGGPVVADGALPASVRCGSCGSAARLRLDRPDGAACEHCGQRTPLPAALAGRVAEAARAVKAAAQAEGAISGVIAALPGRETALRRRLLGLTWGLTAVAAAAGVFGWARRLDDDAWVGFVAFAVAAGPFALIAGLGAARLLPRVVWGVVSHVTALKLPGVEGLGCRVCGAPLPARAEAVLRCEYCQADNLATPAVVEQVQRATAHASASLRAVSARARQADELAAHAVTSFPLLVLLGWFAVAAFAGGVGLRALSDLELDADPSAEFALVDGCVVAVVREAGGVVLVHDFERREPVAAAPPLTPVTALVGKRVRDRADGPAWPTRRVFRPLRAPGRHALDVGESWPIYLPSAGGGGSRVCLVTDD